MTNPPSLRGELEKERETAGKRARKGSPNPWLLRVKGAERNVWEAVLQSFKAMYVYACESFCESALEASGKDGFCEEDGRY